MGSAHILIRPESSARYGSVESSVLCPRASATSALPDPPRSIDVAKVLRNTWYPVMPGPNVRTIASRHADFVSPS